MIKPGEKIRSSDFIISVVAGETLSTRDAVYISPSDGKAYKTDADDLSKLGFIGFVQEGVASGATVIIRQFGMMTGFSGLTAGSIYYVGGTAGAITATRPTNFKIVGVAVSTSAIRITQELTKRVTVLTPNARVGDYSTRFDITNPAGTTFRYTFDGTGTDPNINSGTFPIGTIVDIQGDTFNASNKGLFVVTGVGSNYFEITNASGVAENDKRLQKGYINKGAVWTKISTLQKMRIIGQAGGAGGQAGNTSGSRRGGAGGSAGGYFEKTFFAADLASTVNYIVGDGGVGGIYGFMSLGNDIVGNNGGRTIFGSIVANGGVGTDNPPQAGGTVSGGDINIPGGEAPTQSSGFLGSTGSSDTVPGDGGDSQMGRGGRSTWLSGGTASSGVGYGSGGAGGGKGQITGGNGAPGILILEEEY